MKRATRDAADLLDAVRAAVAKPVDDDPNWKTAREWAQAWNMSHSHTRRLLSEAVVKGLMEHGTRRRRSGIRTLFVPCYRAK